MNFSLTSTVTLSNGVEMPRFGLGAWETSIDDADRVVCDAADLGYIMLDTATAYRNEEGIGRGLTKLAGEGKKLFVSTKIFNHAKEPMEPVEAFEFSSSKLGLKVIDLYFMHWPIKGKYLKTWKGIVELYKAGKVNAIGVSNCHMQHIEAIEKETGVLPMVNQCECHPRLNQKDLRSYCASRGIVFECYSPLMRGHFDIPVLEELAKKHGKTAAQVILRWHLQNGSVIIPKTTSRNRMFENSRIFDFELSAEDMTTIDSINDGTRYCPNPDNFSFD